MASPDCGGPQPFDSLDVVGDFGPCTPVEVNLITEVDFHFLVLILWFSPEKID